MKIYTVSELNQEAREAMLLAFEYPISVKGEITDLRASRGHQYFKLRDQNGKYTVECVIWKNEHRNIKVADYTDMQVIANAKVDFYSGFGKFQLNVSDISEFGDGFLKKEIERLKSKLSKEGIFDLKKDIPTFPEKIGILTAEDSHALKDVCSKLQEKYPLAKVYIYPSTVQGVSAPMNLAKMINKINKDNIVDVLLIVRGGGSLQDLMAFNDENLVREISESRIPTITGIGHKPDITLADYAADSAQETPTAAAVKAVPDCNVLRQDISQLDIAINKAQKQRQIYLSDKISSIFSILKMNAPDKKVKSFHREFKVSLSLIKNLTTKTIKNIQLSLDSKILHSKQVHQMIRNKNFTYSKNISNDLKIIERNISDKVNQLSELVKLKAKQIHQSNPKIILKKGYAIIRDKKYRIIKNSILAKNNEHLKIEMADGYVDVYREKKKT
jgi:exodeoxyribonuclease VII large subunit|tara:strand:+ start:500 stop:1831 length:1332 start_codon:yes stop_codon:yes gene_type:complete